MLSLLGMESFLCQIPVGCISDISLTNPILLCHLGRDFFFLRCLTELTSMSRDVTPLSSPSMQRLTKVAHRLKQSIDRRGGWKKFDGGRMNS